MKFEIKNRYTKSVLFSLECESLKACVIAAIGNGTDLYDADLHGADLRDADLRGTDLRGTDLYDADLRGADLHDADFYPIKWDLFGRLSVWPNEADELLKAINEGKIDGSSYEGKCACFVGTIANIKGCNYNDLNGLIPDSGSLTEVFFTTIREGDTPENNSSSKIASEWVETFIKHRDLARTA